MPPQSKPPTGDLCLHPHLTLKVLTLGKPLHQALCKNEQLILEVIISAMTLAAAPEVISAAQLCLIIPHHLLTIHINGSKAKQGRPLNIRTISHVVCLLGIHRCTQNW